METELSGFVLAFFASKELSLLTAFLCWRPEELAALWRGARVAGVRLRGGGGGGTGAWQALSLPADGARREGVVLDLGCAGAATLLEEASSSRAFNLRYTWLLLHNGTMAGALRAAAVLPDGDVTSCGRGRLADAYRVSARAVLRETPLAGVRTIWSRLELVALWARLPPAAARRRDLGNVLVKSVAVVTQPQHFRGWAAPAHREIDTFPKLTYPLMMLLAEDLHFRHDMLQVDLYGVERNGSFDGLAGRLQRGEVELGATSMFMRADRWRVLHYCAETVELRGAFIFRQPAQSAVQNVFLLPFSRGVWAASGALLASAALTLALLARALAGVAPELALLTPAECLTFVVGVVCQQGFFAPPSPLSARLVMFSTLLLALFAFTAYSAKIVVLLQSPSTSIQSIADLAHSPMALGVQETTYKDVYFAESTDPATQRLYRSKLLPLGTRAYLSAADGMARVRRGLFAFQVEESSGYEVISNTYTEREKCGLQQVPAFKLPMVAVPVRKHSGYRDLFATRLRWQRETGLMERVRREWLAGKPRCDAGGGGFVSVRLGDVLPAVQVLAGGALLAMLLLVMELVVHRGLQAKGMCHGAAR